MNQLILLPQPKEMTCHYDRPIRMDWTIATEPVIDTILIPHGEGYRLEIGGMGVNIVAHDAAGAFYARQTLNQLKLQCPEGVLPEMSIEDWPDFPNRAVMLDISRDKVPTMQTFFDLIDLLSGMKINQLQLYIEHTFAYRNHETVWRNSSPLTAEEVRALDRYCHDRFIKLTPFQNSFGHMHRWLKHDRYRKLAEVPDGWPMAWSMSDDEPFSLCPTDSKSLELIAELYDELLPNFSSPYFMVGCDETFDVGEGRSKEYCERIGGKGKLYLEYILKLYHMVKARGRIMMLYGDIIIKYPELLKELPKDVIIQHWGYGIEYPFKDESSKYKQAGIPFYLLCSNSAYNSLGGRIARCMGNIRNAVFSGLSRGATGILLTDWGDYGHWQPLPVSYPGYLYVAAMSWNAAGNETADIPQALDTFVFRDEAGVMGSLLWDLGNCYLKSKGADHSSNLYMIFRKSDCSRHEEPFCALSVGKLENAIAEIREILNRLEKTGMQTQDAELVKTEIRYAAGLLIAGCEAAIALLRSDVERFSGLDEQTKHKLRQRLEPYFELHSRIWLARNRVGGLKDSLWWNRRLLDQLKPSAPQKQASSVKSHIEFETLVSV